MRKKLTRALAVLAFLIVVLGAAVLIKIGPRFVFGILRYDTRHEGKLRVGDRAPDVGLLALDGTQRVQLLTKIGPRPLVVIFGSFT